MKVMFVCTGNTCRSPMAEAIFKDMVCDVEVYSAGIYAIAGQKASPEAIEVCADNGLDLSNHLATNVGASKINEMDLVLTASEMQRIYLEKSYPDLKISTIKEYAEGYDDLDIGDPIGGTKEMYENCFFEIKKALEKISKKLQY